MNPKGVNCSGYKATGLDPGASAQGTCGFPNVIEISVFPTHDAISGTFIPFLKENYCAGSVGHDQTYIDGGLFTIYSGNGPTTAQIGQAIGIPATPVC